MLHHGMGGNLSLERSGICLPALERRRACLYREKRGPTSFSKAAIIMHSLHQGAFLRPASHPPTANVAADSIDVHVACGQCEQGVGQGVGDGAEIA